MKYIITFLLSVTGSAFSADLEHCEKLTKRNFKIMTKSEMIFHKTYLSIVDANEMSKKVFSQLPSKARYSCRYVMKVKNDEIFKSSTQSQEAVVLYFSFKRRSVKQVKEIDGLLSTGGFNKFGPELFARIRSRAQMNGQMFDFSGSSRELIKLLRDRFGDCTAFLSDDGRSYKIELQKNNNEEIVKMIFNQKKDYSEEALKELGNTEFWRELLEWRTIFHYEREELEIKKMNEDVVRVKTWSIQKDQFDSNSYELYFEEETLVAPGSIHSPTPWKRDGYVVKIDTFPVNFNMSLRIGDINGDSLMWDKGVFQAKKCNE